MDKFLMNIFSVELYEFQLNQSSVVTKYEIENLCNTNASEINFLATRWWVLILSFRASKVVSVREVSSGESHLSYSKVISRLIKDYTTDIQLQSSSFKVIWKILKVAANYFRVTPRLLEIIPNLIKVIYKIISLIFWRKY